MDHRVGTFDLKMWGVPGLLVSKGTLMDKEGRLCTVYSVHLFLFTLGWVWY